MFSNLIATSIFIAITPATTGVSINSFTSDWQSKTAVSAAESGLVALWDLKTGESLAAKKFEKPVSNAIIVKGRTVAVGQETEVVIYDFTTNKEIFRFKQIVGEISYFAVSEDGKRLFAEDFEDGTYCWNLDNGLNIKLPKRVQYGGGIYKDVNNKYLLSGWRDDQKCATWDIDLCQEVSVIDLSGQDEEVRDLSPNGKFAMTWMPDGKMTVWDVVTNTIVKTTKIPYENVFDFFMAPDASKILLIDEEGQVSIEPITQGSSIRLASMDEPLADGGFSFSMDSKLGLLGGIEGEVYVFDLNSGKMLWKKDATSLLD